MILRRFAGLVSAVICLTVLCPAAFCSDGDTLADSVFMIYCVQQQINYTTPWKNGQITQGLGTGFLIDDSRILTNAHNVSNQRYVEIREQNTAQRYIGKVEFVGHDCDLAIIKVQDANFYNGTQALLLGKLPKINSTVQTYGFPIGGTRISVTEGVVSRIQVDNYSHPASDSHLVIQTDAAINPGNSGGPVMQNGKVVGVAFQGMVAADNIGYLIPTTVIKHFIADVNDGSYDGFGSMGVVFFTGLHSKSYCKYLMLPEQAQGVVVLRTLMHSSAESVFQSGDVVSKIDGYNVDNDGMIMIHGLRLSMSEALEQKQVGEKIKVEFYRRGKLYSRDLTLQLNRGIVEQSKQYDKKGRYAVYAGLTFVPLSRDFLETWGDEWYINIGHGLRYLYTFGNQINEDRQLREYVVLSEILPDAVNAYADAFENMAVESINDRKIHSLADVLPACRLSQDYCIIKFIGSQRPLIIDANAAKTNEQIILAKYQVPAEQRLED